MCNISHRENKRLFFMWKLRYFLVRSVGRVFQPRSAPPRLAEFQRYFFLKKKTSTTKMSFFRGRDSDFWEGISVVRLKPT